MSAEQLKVAFGVLPELTARKQMIDMHIFISTALLDEIKRRDLGNFYMLEQSVSTQSKQALLQMLQRKDAGTPQDKLRLYLVYFFTTPEPPKDDLAEYEAALKDAGCDMHVLEATKRLKSFHRMSQMISTAQTSSANKQMASGDLFDRFQSIGTTVPRD